ncbi:ATP-dependent DNA helicase [Phaeocystidibacter marisrubri]|uniref:AAA family ATPase n=1 Tax=Phaeocystidibacter marisrubri TaxID=1577780 RepID=A0A6L3ZEB1_9FLAO|nr:AAA family ATPase [Phaeocystidibacter marisrubri]KAB2815692.1 AAA family ATPase [Phaeocystidibacter marisrubri]GGH65214.1 ATP-dependent exodeoxyribonuclease [Phaeocystidibacter marisrubri]
MDVKPSEIAHQLRANFPFEPTSDQDAALGSMAEFLCDDRKDVVYVLKGYAGTGKTTLVRSLTKTLPPLDFKTVLLSPTGRAAKVMASYSGERAYTIHKAIYIPQRSPGGGMMFGLRPNRASNTLFIVDEASMISDATIEVSRNSLLEDLLMFVQMGSGNKLMLIGDTAQLPPVHYDTSPALDPTVLGYYGKEVYLAELTEVMRQAAESGVLKNATQLRQLQVDVSSPKIEETADVHRLYDGYMIEEALNNANNEGLENVVVIVRSNKRANMYNRQIRSRVHWREDRVATGDYLMVVRNNYFWLPSKSRAGFLANGDIVEVLELRNSMEIHGLSFVDATVRLPDFPDEEPFETKLILDVLDYEGPSLSKEAHDQLFQGVCDDYADEPSRSKRMERVKNDPFFNALQVKFSYAVTGHKAQGGQWKHVFIEHPWLPEGEVDLEYLRWLYTAFTRSSEQVYLIGFPDDFFLHPPQ